MFHVKHNLSYPATQSVRTLKYYLRTLNEQP